MKREVLQVNFAFLVMKTMRFYGWSWAQAMETPVSAFWACYSYVDRVRADESMSQLAVQTFGDASEDGRKQLIAHLKDQIGTVVVEKATFDREGWRTLQNLSQK